MTRQASILLAALAITLGMLSGSSPVRAGTTPEALGRLPTIATPRLDELKAVKRLPKSVEWLSLDYAMMSGGAQFDCDALLAPAELAAAQDGQRPGPQLVIAICAHRDGNEDLALRAWSKVHAGARAQTRPAGRVAGETFVEVVATSDMIAWLAAEQLDAIAESMVITRGGQRLERHITAIDSAGHERRLRFDLTPMITRILDAMSSDLNEGARHASEDFPALFFVAMVLRQSEHEPTGLRALAELALRTGALGGSEQAEAWLEDAVAQGDLVSEMTYAQYLLRKDGRSEQGLRAAGMLRHAADASLPTANVLLSILCEARSASSGCAAGEAQIRRDAAIKALSDAGYAQRVATLLADPALSIFDRAAANQALETAARGGSTLAMNDLAIVYAKGLGVKADAARARRYSQRSAELGSAAAMLELGLYYNAEGNSTRDRQRGVEWLQKAAEAGDLEAMLELGNALLDGKGIERDDAAAARWYAQVAASGDAVGENNYGYVLQSGRGVDKDAAQAASWFRRAANQGDASAARALGAMLESGDGVPQDEVQARQWLQVAASYGDAAAMRLFAFMLREGRGGAVDLTSACDWFEKASAGKDVVATRVLGYCFATGEGRTPDIGHAIELYRAAALQGDAVAMRNLGLLLQDAPAPDGDAALGLQWLRRAADAGDSDAFNSLGWSYEHGQGTPVDFAAAVDWYRRGSDADEPLAVNNLARMYRNGTGVATDAVKARELFERAIGLKSHYALCNLGEMLDNGEGGEIDAERGFGLQLKAAIAGNPGCAMRFYQRNFLSVHDQLHWAQARDALQADWLNLTPDAKLALINLLLYWTDGANDKANGRTKLLALAESDFRAAHRWLAIAYLNGTMSGKPDLDNARIWYQKAADEGDGDAGGQLALLYYFGAGIEHDLVKARSMLETAIKQQDGETYDVDLGRLYLASGEYQLAQPLLARAHARGALLGTLSLSRLCRSHPVCEGDAAEFERMWHSADSASAGDKNEVAWSVVTDPQADASEIQLAVSLMESVATEIDDKPALLDTLAAAYAAAGNFERAIAVEAHAIDVARQHKSTALTASLERHLQRFRAKQALPWPY